GRRSLIRVEHVGADLPGVGEPADGGACRTCPQVGIVGGGGGCRTPQVWYVAALVVVGRGATEGDVAAPARLAGGPLRASAEAFQVLRRPVVTGGRDDAVLVAR